MSDVTLSELKKSFDEIRSTFEEHKKVADARMEAMKAQKSTSDFDEKLDRINETLSKAEKTQRDWNKQQDTLAATRAAEELAWKTEQRETERKMEARINRAALGLGGGMGDDESAGKRALERKAYTKFLRRGLEHLGADEVKVLTVANDTTGGYLAPPTYIQDIIKAAVLFSPMRALVSVKQSSTGELMQPKRTRTAQATRMSETGTRSETQNVTWGMMKIPAPEMYAEARISQANLEDSAFNLEAELSQEFSEQFGVTEGNEVINGTGSGQCLGILDANAAGPSTPITFTVSGAAATIAGASGLQADGLVNMFHALKSAYAQNASFILNRGSLGKVRLLKDTNGQFLWQPGGLGSGLNGIPSTILGAPYTECPDMPDQGANAFPIAFGDWKRAYVLHDRIEMAIMRDPYSLQSSGQVKFTARRRVGGQVVLGEAIGLLKCST